MPKFVLIEVAAITPGFEETSRVIVAASPEDAVRALLSDLNLQADVPLCVTPWGPAAFNVSTPSRLFDLSVQVIPVA